jgi:predicted kinase
MSQTPILYIMCGVGFSGKSILAQKIAEHTGAVLVSQDALFFELEKKINIDQDSDEQWEMLLAICKERILENLKVGKSVVFDDTNTQFEHRQELRGLAASVNGDTKVVFLDTPIEIQKERQLKNKETGERHDVKQEYLDQAIDELEIPTKNENVIVFKPDSNLELFLESLK